MPWSWVDIQYSIHRVQHTLSTTNTKYSIHRVKHRLSTAYTEYCIHPVHHTPSTAYTEYSIHRVQHIPSTALREYSIHRVHHIPSTALREYCIHRVQHTPSTAYTEYSIHRVQHTPITAYTEYSIHRVQCSPKNVCLPCILMITSWPLNVASASGMPPYTINRHQLAHHARSKVMSPYHSHVYESIHWWIESQHPARCPSPGFKYSSSLAQSWPPKFISNLTRSRPPSITPNSHDYSLQLCTIIASKCICTLAWSRSQSASLSSINHGCQVHLETRWITDLECISEFTRLSFSGPPQIGLQ
jgi:hypothetical protein